MSDEELIPPKERQCDRCGRRDVWDDGSGHWKIALEDGEPQAGDGFCIHEWDVNGSYNPFGPPSQ